MPSRSAALFALTALTALLRYVVRGRPSRATIRILKNCFGAVGEGKIARIMVWTRDLMYHLLVFQMYEWSALHQDEELSWHSSVHSTVMHCLICPCWWITHYTILLKQQINSWVHWLLKNWDWICIGCWLPNWRWFGMQIGAHLVPYHKIH